MVPVTLDLDPRLEDLLRKYEDVLERRTVSVDAHAGLWARFGPGGTVAALKHQQLAKLKRAARTKNPSLSEAQLKELVEASAEWGQYLTRLETDRSEYLMSKNAIDGATASLHLLATKLRLLGAMVALDASDSGDEPDDDEAS